MGNGRKICRSFGPREAVRRLPSDEARCGEATARERGGAAGSSLGFRGAARGVRHERWRAEDWETAVCVVMETTRERSERTIYIAYSSSGTYL
ncbi:hypothetical protein PR202_ga10461 [Eleusine coracana subsp. coracana]|uniref:Uncharacterized protein n=1 Tax=Eleusine coracana subsp. coracana TaxID=191504 RepID=A0AAV5C6S9_ELECO|nr:hypothetical protein PR202_ga10461 [Eleusine coracana subsp. coracana]